MKEGFSDSTKLWIEKQDVFISAEQRFCREWGNILRNVQSRLSKQGWACRLMGDPPDMIQLYRPYWPSGPGQVHYEVWCKGEFYRAGIVDFGLHMERDLPNQNATCERIRLILGPHIPKILTSGVISIPEQPSDRILKGLLPLKEITVENICEVVENMMQTESLIDESLFVADKTMVWRTDFSPSSPPVYPHWFSEVGGQESVLGAGRFGSWAWRIDGTRPNARKECVWERGCYCVLVGGDTKNLICNGTEYYGTAVVKTSKGAHWCLWADGHEYESKEEVKSLPQAFNWKCYIPPADKWQCVTWRGAVPTVEKVMAFIPPERGGGEIPVNFNFAENGAWITLNIQTEDREFLIDSVEIGRCS